MSTDPYYVALGAHYWMRENPQASLIFFPDGIYDADTCLAALKKEIGRDHSDLEANLETIGLKAVAEKPRNESRVRITKPMVLDDKLAAQCFPPCDREHWAEIDASVPSSKSDEEGRHTRGPTWNRNSCAVDCVMVAGLLLDGGRRHVDQIDSAFQTTMSFPARALRHILMKPWSKLSQEDINNLRDVLRETLETHDGDRFKIGDYLAIGQVANVLLSGMPQLLTTITKVFRCADGYGMAFRTKDDGTLRTTLMLGCLGGMDSTRTSWEIPAGMERNPGALMSLYFQPRPATKEELKRDPQPCCEREDCPGTETQLVVVDRLAPVLMLEENWEGNGFKFQPRKTYTITYSDETFTEHSAAYRVVGIVHNVGSHFTLDWYVGKNRLVYDGIVNGSIAQKRGARLSSTKKALIFMERVGEM